MNKILKITLIVILVSAAVFGALYLIGSSKIEDKVMACTTEAIESGVAEGNDRAQLEMMFPMLRNICIQQLTARGEIPVGAYQ